MTGDILVGAAKHAHDWVDYWTVGSTIAGATILLAYTIAAFCQVILTGRAIREAREGAEQNKQQGRDALALAMTALEHGRRAWLSATLKEETLEVSAGTKFLEFTIRNTGGVPATDIRSGGVDCVVARLSPKDFAAASVPSDKVAYIAGGDTSPHIARSELSSDDVIAIKNETKTWWVYLEIKYTDCYTKSRVTTFCWKYNPELTKWISEPDFCRIT